LEGETLNDPDFSEWKGQRPTYPLPDFFKVTASITTSYIVAASLICWTVWLGIIALLFVFTMFTVKRCEQREREQRECV